MNCKDYAGQITDRAHKLLQSMLVNTLLKANGVVQVGRKHKHETGSSGLAGLSSLEHS